MQELAYAAEAVGFGFFLHITPLEMIPGLLQFDNQFFIRPPACVAASGGR